MSPVSSSRLPRPEPDGIVLLEERGRTLSEQHVVEVTGTPVVATVAMSEAVARTIDSGLCSPAATAYRASPACARSSHRANPQPRSPVARPLHPVVNRTAPLIQWHRPAVSAMRKRR